MALIGNSNEEKIWNYLSAKINNSYGVAGLMGNLYAESGLRPDNLQNSYEKSLGLTDAQYTAAVDNGSYTNFVRDKAGYGLAQWTYWSRKENMYNYVKNSKASIGDLETQLNFLYKELSEGYKAVLADLKAAKSVLEASNSVLLKFEKPADQSVNVQNKRASYGQVYYDKYAKASGGGASEKIDGGAKMSNSSLVNVTSLSPNHSGKRTHAIDRITPHCFVGQVTVERGLEVFKPTSRQASCNYVIAYDGKVGLCVDEANRSWCSSSNSNDQRAVTIEVASDSIAPYAFKNAAYNKLIDLCADICKRNGKNVLLWIDNKDKALAYEPKSNEMVLTVHRWFANKSCPGDWMYARMGDLASKVTAKLSGGQAPEKPEVKPESQPSGTLYRVQVGAYSVKANADAQLAKVKAAGFSDAFVTKVDNLYKVQVGAYSVKKNADNMLANIKSKGFDAFITTVSGTQVSSTPATKSYMVRVTADALNIRKGPGTNYAIVGCITDKGSYTIVEENNGWGKLKSGIGWISLGYTKKC